MIFVLLLALVGSNALYQYQIDNMIEMRNDSIAYLNKEFTHEFVKRMGTLIKVYRYCNNCEEDYLAIYERKTNTIILFYDDIHFRELLSFYDSSSSPIKWIKWIVAHEFFHSMDNYMGYLQEDKEWDEMFMHKNESNFKRKYGMTNSREDKATTFELMMGNYEEGQHVLSSIFSQKVKLLMQRLYKLDYYLFDILFKKYCNPCFRKN